MKKSYVYKGSFLLLSIFLLIVHNIAAYEFYQIRVSGCSVKLLNAQQNFWDEALKGDEKAPDVYVVIYRNGKPILKTMTQKDSYHPYFIEATDFYDFDDDDIIDIKVFDSDSKLTGSFLVPYEDDHKMCSEKLESLLKQEKSELIYAWSSSFENLKNTQSIVLPDSSVLIKISHHILKREIPKNVIPSSIYISSLEVLNEKKKFQTWDKKIFRDDAMPDVYYLLYVNGIPRLVSGVYRDSLKAKWPECKYAFPLTIKDRITFKILDVDRTSTVLPPAISPYLPLVFTKKEHRKKNVDMQEELFGMNHDDVIAIWEGNILEYFDITKEDWNKFTTFSATDKISGARFLHQRGIKSILLKAKRLVSSVPKPKVYPQKEIILTSIHVLSRKKNGKKWDFGLRAKPDIYVKIYRKEKKSGSKFFGVR